MSENGQRCSHATGGSGYQVVKRIQRLTLLEAQVGDFVNGRALTVHEGEELIEEELLFRVREPAALTAGLHAAHHVLLKGRRHRGKQLG